MAKRKRKPTVTQSILSAANKNIDTTTVYSKSREQYKRDARKFVKFCCETHGCRTLEECQLHIQDYSNWLISRDYSASTIHTYLVAAVKACNNAVRLSDIQKPIRHTAEYKRGRGALESSKKVTDFYNSEHARLYEFCRRVGIRRNEIANLRKGDWCFDESTQHWCVIVRNGKGKKFHLQLTDLKDKDFLESNYFIGDPDEYVFSETELNNDLNIHALRQMRAKQLYFDTLKKVRSDPEYIKILEERIIARWNKYNIDKHTGKPKPFPYNKLLGGTITLRGRNRQLAISNNLPITYNSTVLTYISFVALSHWRNSVTLESYIVTNNK